MKYWIPQWQSAGVAGKLIQTKKIELSSDNNLPLRLIGFSTLLETE
jgi:hypothetical protein